MRRCGECSVDYAGDLDRCPLCGTPLTGDATPAAFPVHAAQAPARAARRVLLLIALGCAVAIGVTAFLVGLRPGAIVFAYIALLLNYLVVRNIVVHSLDFMRTVQRYFLVLLAVVVLAWLATGDRFVSAWVVPGVCFAGVITNALLVVIYRDAFVNDYAKYLVYSLLLGVAPLLLIPLGAAPWPWAVFASAGASVLLGTALLIFTRHQMRDEMRKLFST